MSDSSNYNPPCKDNSNKYYSIQLGLKKDFDLHVDESATYLCSQDDAKCQSTETWFDLGTFPFDGIAISNGYVVDKLPCYTLFNTSKALLNRKFYNEHPILHQHPRYSINKQPIQVANDQIMTVKNIFDFLWRSYF